MEAVKKMEKKLIAYFGKEKSEEYLARYRGLYYDDLRNRYVSFVVDDELVRCVQPRQIMDPILRAAITDMAHPAHEALAHETILMILEQESAKRTEEEFDRAVYYGDKRALERILRQRDPDGTYKKLLKGVIDKETAGVSKIG